MMEENREEEAGANGLRAGELLGAAGEQGDHEPQGGGARGGEDVTRDLGPKGSLLGQAAEYFAYLGSLARSAPGLFFG